MGGTTTVHGCPPLCTSDQKQQPAVRAQGPNTYRSRCFLPDSHQLRASFPGYTFAAAYHMARGGAWIAPTMLGAETE